MPARWYRSRFFWFGLPGFLLLLGLWLGHSGTVTRVQWAAPGTRAWIMAWGGGEVGVCVSTERVMQAPGIDTGSMRIAGPIKISLRHGAGAGRSTWPLARGSIREAFLQEQQHGSPAPAMVLDLRVLVSIYTVIWLGGLLAWQRRKHRLLCRTPGLAAASASARGWE